MTGRRERERNDRATQCVCAERVRTHHNFQRDAVALTAAMLGIADFRKSDPQTIIEATSMLYGCAYNILYRMHAEHTTRNTETLEALAEQDYEEANQVAIAQTGNPIGNDGGST